MSDPDAIARAEEIMHAVYVETYGAHAGELRSTIPDPLREATIRRFAAALSETGDDGMLMQAPKTGDWFRPGRVLRVQLSDDKKSVHIVTDDGAQMSVPVDDGEDPAGLRDHIAQSVMAGPQHQ